MTEKPGELERFVAGLHDYLARAFAPLVRRVDEQGKTIEDLRRRYASLEADLETLAANDFTLSADIEQLAHGTAEARRKLTRLASRVSQ